MYREKIYNIQTGEESYRDYTEIEIEIAKKAEEKEALRIANFQNKEKIRQSALSKLIDLGLTEEEIAAL